MLNEFISFINHYSFQIKINRMLLNTQAFFAICFLLRIYILNKLSTILTYNYKGGSMLNTSIFNNISIFHYGYVCGIIPMSTSQQTSQVDFNKLHFSRLRPPEIRANVSGSCVNVKGSCLNEISFSMLYWYVNAFLHMVSHYDNS